MSSPTILLSAFVHNVDSAAASSPVISNRGTAISLTRHIDDHSENNAKLLVLESQLSIACGVSNDTSLAPIPVNLICTLYY